MRTSAIESAEFQAFLKESPDNKVPIDQLADTYAQEPGLAFVPNAFEAAGGAWVDILVNKADPTEAFATAKVALEEAAAPVLEALDQIEG